MLEDRQTNYTNAVILQHTLPQTLLIVYNKTLIVSFDK